MTLQDLENRIIYLENLMRRHNHDGVESEELGFVQTVGLEIVEHGFADPGGLAAITISDLAGDTDNLYRLIIRARFNSDESTYKLTFNGDNGNNYNNSSGTLLQQQITLAIDTGKDFMHDIVIHAKSGIFRTILWNQLAFKDGGSFSHRTSAGIWRNTFDEITSITLTASQNFLTTSEYWLYKGNA
jgi:hypothetical protein